MQSKKSALVYFVVAFIMIGSLVGCKPDKMIVEIYTSDIQEAMEGSTLDIPVTLTFSLMGNDDEGLLPKATEVAKRYLNNDAEIKLSKGDFGDVMVIKCNIPIGNADTLKDSNSPVGLLVFEDAVIGNSVKLIKGHTFDTLNQDLKGINFMLSAELPANSTVFRVISDTKSVTDIGAIAVFVDNKAELLFNKKLKRRESVDIEYRGGDASVYSTISPLLSVAF